LPIAAPRTAIGFDFDSSHAAGSATASSLCNHTKALPRCLCALVSKSPSTPPFPPSPVRRCVCSASSAAITATDTDPAACSPTKQNTTHVVSTEVVQLILGHPSILVVFPSFCCVRSVLCSSLGLFCLGGINAHLGGKTIARQPDAAVPQVE